MSITYENKYKPITSRLDKIIELLTKDSIGANGTPQPEKLIADIKDADENWIIVLPKTHRKYLVDTEKNFCKVDVNTANDKLEPPIPSKADSRREFWLYPHKDDMEGVFYAKKTKDINFNIRVVEILPNERVVSREDVEHACAMYEQTDDVLKALGFGDSNE